MRGMPTSHLLGLHQRAVRREPADLMERLAGDAHALAFEMREPRTSIMQAEQIIAEGERIGAEIRRLVRG